MKKWIASCCGAGLVPGMPGTYASLLSAALFYVLFLVLIDTALIVVAAAIVIVATAAACWLCPWAEDYFKEADPGRFVLDEVVGQFVTLLIIFLLASALKPLGARPLAHVAAGFILFRAFDVAKPWPIRSIESIPGSAGVILDDVAAAVYAAAGAIIMIYFVRGLVTPEIYDAAQAMKASAFKVVCA